MTKSKSRIKSTGEVFTPRSLIHQMLNKLPNDVWFNPVKRWLEPSAGDGNFLVEIKARLMQAGHDEKYILDHMIYGIELIDDNHWVLQHRLGYFKDGKPNSAIWSKSEITEAFKISKIHSQAQDLNQKNPYFDAGLCERDEVLHHRNMVCASALEYDMEFGRNGMIDSAAILSPFSYAEFDANTQSIIEAQLTDVAPEQIENAFAETILIYWAMKHGMLGPKSVFYGAPCLGAKFIQPFLNGRVLFRTINEARPELVDNLELSDEYDYLVVFVFDNDTLSFTPYAVYQSGQKVPMAKWSIPHDLGEWTKTDTPDVGEMPVVQKQLAQTTPEVVHHPTPKIVKTVAPDKESQAKIPKAKVLKTKDVSTSGPGGGWTVKHEWYGTGHVVRCSSPVDGVYWECDHDALVDLINESLLAKGLIPIGPDKKAFSSSTGLRGGNNIWRECA